METCQSTKDIKAFDQLTEKRKFFSTNILP